MWLPSLLISGVSFNMNISAYCLKKAKETLDNFILVTVPREDNDVFLTGMTFVMSPFSK